MVISGALYHKIKLNDLNTAADFLNWTTYFANAFTSVNEPIDGDTEVVVEDIERMNMDYHDKYDRQQLDWRMLTEDNFGQARLNYTGEPKYRILGGVSVKFVLRHLTNVL